MTKTIRGDKKEKKEALALQTNSPTVSATPMEMPAALPIPVELNAEVLKELNLKVTQAIKNEIKQKTKTEQTQEEFVHLQNIVSEYLKCFLIMGYTFQGQAITIGYANTPQDYNSIVEQLRQTFFQTMNKIGNGG
jgi:hypothetical protein